MAYVLIALCVASLGVAVWAALGLSRDRAALSGRIYRATRNRTPRPLPVIPRDRVGEN